MLALLALVLVLILQGQGAAAAHSRPPIPFRRCAELGFTTASLPCSACELVAASLGSSSEAVAECRACCSPALDAVVPRKYKRVAVVLLGEPRDGVAEFMEKAAGRWKQAAAASAGSSATAWHWEQRQIIMPDGDVAEHALVFSEPLPLPGSAKAALATESSFTVPIGSFKIEHIETLLAAKLPLAAGQVVGRERD